MSSTTDTPSSSAQSPSTAQSPSMTTEDELEDFNNNQRLFPVTFQFSFGENVAKKLNEISLPEKLPDGFLRLLILPHVSMTSVYFPKLTKKEFGNGSKTKKNWEEVLKAKSNKVFYALDEFYTTNLNSGLDIKGCKFLKINKLVEFGAIVDEPTKTIYFVAKIEPIGGKTLEEMKKTEKKIQEEIKGQDKKFIAMDPHFHISLFLTKYENKDEIEGLKKKGLECLEKFIDEKKSAKVPEQIKFEKVQLFQYPKFGKDPLQRHEREIEHNKQTKKASSENSQI